MVKRRIDRAEFHRKVLLAICALFFFAYAFQTISFTACVNFHVNNEQSYATAEYGAVFYKGINIGIRCFLFSIGAFLARNRETIAAFSTLVIAYYTYTLWKSTDGLHKAAIKQSKDMTNSLAIAEKSADAAVKANEIADKTLKENRAWLGVDNVLVMVGVNNLVGLVANLHVKVQVIIRNHGRTPALQVRGGFRGDVFPANSPPDFALEEGQSEFPLSPNATISYFPWQGTLTDEEIRQINSGEKILFIFGFIKYYDIYKQKERVTKFRSRYRPEIGVFGNTKDGNSIE